MTAIAPQTRYYFSLTCPLVSENVGELADGLRYHIDYGTNGAAGPRDVTTDLAKYKAAWVQRGADGDVRDYINTVQAAKGMNAPRLPRGVKGCDGWFGVTADIKSGADLARVRKDGVVIFDARVTLAAIDGALIQGIFSGVLDLGGRAAYDKLVRYTSGQHALDGQGRFTYPVQLTARFEAASNAPDFAAQRYKDSAALGWKYQRLTTGQFVAVGDLTFSDKDSFPASTIDMDVHELFGV